MMIGRITSHYKILGNLGVGGLGVAYKAHGLNVRRLVALSFLHAHFRTEESQMQTAGDRSNSDIQQLPK